MYKKLVLTLSLTLSLLIAGCSSLFPDAYRIDIPQGNLVSQEKIESLEIGMNRQQVQFILGSPLLVDTFNQNRWDYFYSVNTQKGTTIQHHITVIFVDGAVKDIIQN